MELDASPGYEGADLPRAQRFTKALWTIGAIVVVVLLPFFPPTELIGSTGWFVAAGVVALAFLACAFIWSVSLRWTGLLVVLYAGWALISTVQLLAGPAAPYEEINLLLVAGVALMHPLRVALPYTCVVVAGHVLQMTVHDGVSTSVLGRTTMQAVVWIALTVVLSSIMKQTRGQRKQLDDERSTDSLTGLPNRREFDARLDRLVDAHHSSGDPLALIVADVNGFKQLNDAHGHLAGDAQLVTISRVLPLGVELPDACFRWGGDEFAVLLPGSSEAGAADIAARIQGLVADACLAPEQLTIGVGYTALVPGDDAESLVERADRMLLEGKRARRNRRASDRNAATVAAAGAVSSAG